MVIEGYLTVTSSIHHKAFYFFAAFYFFCLIYHVLAVSHLDMRFMIFCLLSHVHVLSMSVFLVTILAFVKNHYDFILKIFLQN